MTELIGAWGAASEEDAEKHRNWSRDLAKQLAKKSFRGGYVSLLNAEEGSRSGELYGDAYERLQRPFSGKANRRAVRAADRWWRRGVQE